MRTFYEHIEHRKFNENLATCLVATNSVNYFCNETLEMAKAGILTEELLIELFGGLRQKAAGLFGGLKNYGQAAAGPAMAQAKQWGQQKLQQGANWAGQKIQQGKQWVGDKAQQIGQAVGPEMQKAGQYMNQASQAEAMKQAINAVAGLQKQLAGMGIPQEWLQKSLAPLSQALQQEIENNKNLGHKVGSTGYEEPAPTAPAPNTLPNNMAVGATPQQQQVAKGGW